MPELDIEVPDTYLPIQINVSTCSTYDQATCEAHSGCHWWNGSCHGSLPTCTGLDNPGDCAAYGCFWWGSPASCHAEPEPNPCLGKPQSQCLSPCSWWCGSCNEVALTEILDQKQETHLGNDYISGTKWWAQSFIPTVSTITKLEVYINRYSITAGFVIDIRDQIIDFTLPPLQSIIIPSNLIPETPMQWITVDLNLLGDCCSVTPGATHYLVFHTEGNVGAWNHNYPVGFYQGTSADDKYIGGQLYVTATAGTTWTWTSYPYYDVMFRVYGM